MLVLSRTRDPEADEVTRLLRKIGVPSARINADELASLDFLVDPGRGAARLGGRWLTPTVTWIRHFSVRAIEAAEPAYRLFARDSWDAAAQALAAISGVSIGHLRPGLGTQLRIAAQHGVEIPRTLIATGPAQAATLLPAGRVVVKALHLHFVEATPGQLTGIFPTVTKLSCLAAWPQPGPPVVVQEYVEHQAELRVHYIDGCLRCFQISKQAPADPWLNSSQVEVRPVKAPPAVDAATRTLASALGLRCGAFDFLVRDGSPVFLEASADGDWRWLEHKIGSSPVSEATASMLGALHREHLPPQRAAGSRSSCSFSLLTFLAG